MPHVAVYCVHVWLCGCYSYEDFKPQFHLWRIFLMGRKLCFACVVVLGSTVESQVRVCTSPTSLHSLVLTA